MTDADVDGAHIRTLLLTLFYRHFKPIIETGHLYIAQPPLYRVQKGKEVRYVYSDTELDKTSKALKSVKDEPVKAKGKKAEEIPTEVQVVEGTDQVESKIPGLNIQRYKGLGEMNPDQLWDTTMNPENRVLSQVRIEDAERSDAIFTKLMGDEVSLRKTFIQTRAKNANLDELDI